MEVNDELREQAEKAHQPFDRKVGATMAIIAAVLALVAVSGHISTTEELLAQQKASDQWAFYQAKSLRRYQSEAARDILAAIGSAKSAQLSEKYVGSAERYTKEGDEIQAQARELEKESEVSGRRALRLHLGEIFLEMALVLASLAILTKRGILWGIAVASSSIGAVVASTGLFIH
jgi:uncharacterized protein DUF4337